MRAWWLLAGAIASEVTGTMALRATVDNSAWIPMVVVGYVSTFILLGLTLRAGVPLGVAYGIWGASGVALTAVLAYLLFGETLSVAAIIGIGLIIAGVILVETGSHTRADPESLGDIARGDAA